MSPCLWFIGTSWFYCMGSFWIGLLLFLWLFAGPSANLKNRRLFTNSDTAQPSTSSHQSAANNTSSQQSGGLVAYTQHRASEQTDISLTDSTLSDSAMLTGSSTLTHSGSDTLDGTHISIPEPADWTEISSLNTDVTSITHSQPETTNSADTRTGGTRHPPTLTLPDEQWDWSPFKQTSSHRWDHKLNIYLYCGYDE